MSNSVYAYFASEKGGFGTIPFPVVYDCPISEDFSETLDSATIIVPNLPEASALKDLEPYQGVTLKVSIGGSYKSYSFLVDTFTERETNPDSLNRHYTYTIDLMSETKMLEKVQCPNICVTHSEVSGQSTIYQKIVQYVNAYSPVVKIDTSAGPTQGGMWHYGKLITIGVELQAKFDVPCADISMSQPTLRQALTSLMIQVGCIPTLKNGVLGFLDLREDLSAVPFSASESQLIVERSMASDSYVNSLVNMNDDVVDSEDSVVSESLCFRDRDNVLLKQQSNLKLETRFPIYKVTSLKVNAYCQTQIFFNRSQTIPYCLFNSLDLTAFMEIYAYVKDDSNEVLAIHASAYDSSSHDVRGTLSFTAYLCKWQQNPTTGWGFTVVGTKTASVELDGAFTSGNGAFYSYNNLFAASNYSKAEAYDNAFTMVRATFTGTIDARSFTNQKMFCSDAAISNNLDDYIRPAMFAQQRLNRITVPYQKSVGYNPSAPGGAYDGTYGWFVSFLYSKDISPLCVENSKRSQLEVDFLAMPDARDFSDVEDMSRWLYCTVGYSIGSKDITGFSETYSKTNGWWTNSYTYSENIMNALWTIDPVGDSTEGIISSFGGALDGFTVGKYEQEAGTHNGADLQLNYTKIINPFFAETVIDSITVTNNFSLMFFNLEYIPLNSVNMRHFKDKADLPIEQLDSSQNGISSCETLSLNQQDSIDRFANDVLSIHQRCLSLADIQPCPSLFRGEYTVFKREIKIGQNAIDVCYYASKDYVIKNYFTSIQTKYRAYEYVDYNSSIIRKEADVIHMMVSSRGYLDGDDKIATAISSVGAVFSSVDGIGSAIGSRMKYSYFAHVNGGNKEGYKEECSILCTDSSVYLSYGEFDNGSDGIYVDGAYLTSGGAYSSNPIGGIPQKWYPLTSEWAESDTAEIGFVTELGELAPLPLYNPNSPAFTDWIRTIQRMPKFTYANMSSDKIAVLRPFKKDLTERIFYTLQFDFYPEDDSVELGRWLFEASSMMGKSLGTYVIYDDPSFRKEAYQGTPSGLVSSSGVATVETYEGPYRAKIAVNFGGHSSVKFVCLDKAGKYHDMIVFRDSSKTVYYVSPNDTKGTGVFSYDLTGGAKLLVKSRIALLNVGRIDEPIGF